MKSKKYIEKIDRQKREREGERERERHRISERKKLTRNSEYKR